jgi:regulator of RNase E activity RraA
MSDADGIIFLETEEMPLVYDWAEKSWKQEESLAAEIETGKSLGDLLGIETLTR